MGITGRWRIVETELWDSDVLDLVGPAFIEFGEDGLGSFGFIAVQGQMDCRETVRDGRPGAEFSWEGSDECDPASGRGWAVLEEDGSLRGRIFFHLGDDSGFVAVRDNKLRSGTDTRKPNDDKVAAEVLDEQRTLLAHQFPALSHTLDCTNNGSADVRILVA